MLGLPHPPLILYLKLSWYEWYNIEVRGWYFLESEEGVGYCLNEGKDIQMAISGLGGTSVANFELIRNNTTIKIIAGITNLSYFKWPITGDHAGYIQAQTLPNVGLCHNFHSMISQN